MMRAADAVERAVPFVVAFDLPFYRRDLKIAERHIGEQCRELREKRQERFARGATGVTLPFEATSALFPWAQ